MIANAPTTQIRLLVADGLAIATAARYFTSATWAPSEAWLLFVLGFAGVAAAQWYGKRTTEWKPAPPGGPNGPDNPAAAR